MYIYIHFFWPTYVLDLWKLIVEKVWESWLTSISVFFIFFLSILFVCRVQICGYRLLFHHHYLIFTHFFLGKMSPCFPLQGSFHHQRRKTSSMEDKCCLRRKPSLSHGRTKYTARLILFWYFKTSSMMPFHHNIMPWLIKQARYLQITYLPHPLFHQISSKIVSWHVPKISFCWK